MRELSVYIEINGNGIYVGKQLLVTYETMKQPFNPKLLERKLRDFFQL